MESEVVKLERQSVAEVSLLLDLVVATLIVRSNGRLTSTSPNSQPRATRYGHETANKFDGNR